MRKYFLLALLAPTAALSGCEREKPSDVCAAEETISTVKSMIFDQLVDPAGAADLNLDILQQAFNDTTSLDLPRYEGIDRETGKISCVATLRSTRTVAQVTVDYARQPKASSDDFVYSVEGIPRSTQVYQIAAGVTALYDVLMMGAPVDPPEDQTPYATPGYVPAAPPGPAQEAVDAVPSPQPSSLSTPPPVTVPQAEKATAPYIGPPVIVPGPPPPPAPPRPRASPRSYVEGVTFSRAPTPVFPDIARQNGVHSGSVTLQCESTPNGSLDGCEVASETPDGMGFGAAAVLAAKAARLSPSSVDYAGGDPVRFVVRFRDQ